MSKVKDPATAAPVFAYVRQTYERGEGRGGWGAIIEDIASGKCCRLKGDCDCTSDRRAGLTGVVQVISTIQAENIQSPLKIYVPFADMVPAMTEWIYDWLAYGFVSQSSGNPIANEDLWRELHALREKYGAIEFAVASKYGEGSKKIGGKMEEAKGLARVAIDKPASDKPEVLQKVDCPRCGKTAKVYAWGAICGNPTCKHRWDPSDAPTFEEQCERDLES